MTDRKPMGAVTPACKYFKPALEPKTLGEWVQLELNLGDCNGSDARKACEGQDCQDSQGI